MSQHSWDQYTENLCRKWAEKAHEQSVLHSFACRHYTWWSRALGVPSVILNAVTTSTTFATLNQTEGTTAKVIRTLIGVALFISTGLIAANQFLRFSKQASYHASIVSQYEKMLLEIEEQLAYARFDRIPASKFVADLRRQTIEIRRLDSASPIPQSVRDKYYSQLDKILARWTVGPVNRHRHVDSKSNSTSSSKKGKDSDEQNGQIEVVIINEEDDFEETKAHPPEMDRSQTLSISIPSLPECDTTWPNLSPRFRRAKRRIDAIRSREQIES